MKVNRKLLRASRLLHVYLSAFLLIVLMFFSVTGVLLNHPSWFQGQSTESVQEVEFSGSLPLELVSVTDIPPKLEQFFSDLGLNLKHTEIEIDEELLIIEQQKPGVAISVEFDMATGVAELITTKRGLVTTLNDLHKGRHAKQLWKWLIDLSAALVIVFSLAGILLLLPQKSRLYKIIFYSVLGLPLFIYAALN